MIARIGVTNKRLNSTFQPDSTDWLSVDVLLKQACDIDAPVFDLFFEENTLPWGYNYMYIPSIQSYFWITDIISVRNNVWNIAASMDILATAKTTIMNTDAFVEYGFNVDASGSQYRLHDQRQNVSNVPSIYTAKVDITDGAISKTGFYVLSAVGANGGVTSYRVTAQSMRALLNTIGQDITDAIDAMESFDEIFKYFTVNSLMQGSAISAIRSCIWLPIKTSEYVGDPSDIYLGDYNTGVSGVVLTGNPIITKKTSLSIPWPVSDWRRMNCQILMYVPFVGTVGVPVDQCNNQSTITVTWCVELIGGGFSIRINAGDYTIYTGSGNVGTSYAIGSSNVPITNFVGGLAQTVGGAINVGLGVSDIVSGTSKEAMTAGLAGSGQIRSGAQNIMSGIGDIGHGIVQTLTPVIQCSGTLTGSAALGQSTDIELTLLYYPPIDDDTFSSIYGHPVMRISKPVAGYCRTRGFSIGGNLRGIEKARINAMMDGGVFIE